MNSQQNLVRYRLKPDRVQANVERIQAVFRELKEHRLTGLHYAVYRLADETSFVHILTYASEAEQEAFRQLPAFREFQAQPKDRFEEGPFALKATVIGEY